MQKTLMAVPSLHHPSLAMERGIKKGVQMEDGALDDLDEDDMLDDEVYGTCSCCYAKVYSPKCCSWCVFR